MTHADEIRSMTDDELIKFIDWIIDNHNDWYNTDVGEWIKEEVDV